jgi:hypothetical protein
MSSAGAHVIERLIVPFGGIWIKRLVRRASCAR